MLEAEQQTKLPRLLDLDDAPPVNRRRRYWRYVHQWRKRLSYLWRQDATSKSDRVEIGRGVDDLLATALLLASFGDRDAPISLPLWKSTSVSHVPP